MLNFNRISLGTKIFTSLVGLVLVAFLMIALVTYFQYKEQVKDYNEERLERKESSIRKMIDFILERTTFELKTDKIPFIFNEDDMIFETANVQGENLTLYDFKGNPLITSTEELFDSPKMYKIPKETLYNLCLLYTSPSPRD